MPWIPAVAFIVVAVWLVRVVRAVRQLLLARALEALKRRVADSQPGLLESETYRWVKVKTRAKSAAPLGPLTPRAWLGRHLDRARDVTVLLSNVRNELSPDNALDLERLLDAEQRLLSRSKVAFTHELPDYACPHVAGRMFEDDEYRKEIPQLWYAPQGNRASERRWCRHCLLAFEQSWPIAVSGGY
jgi:hypothetical protein